MKENHNMKDRFRDLCEVQYLLVHKFHCLRQKLLLKFAPDFDRRVDAFCSTCFSLSGQTCSGCYNSHDGKVSLNGRVKSKEDILSEVKKRKGKILNYLNHPTHILTWNAVMADYEDTPAIAMWAMLELMLVDRKITISLVINMNSGRRKHLLLDKVRHCEY